MEPTLRAMLANGLILAGAGLLTGAGFAIGAWAALLIAGGACIVLGIAIGRSV